MHTNSCGRGYILMIPGTVASENTIRSPNVALMLDQRRRRWTSIRATLGQCLALYFWDNYFGRHKSVFKLALNVIQSPHIDFRAPWCDG